MKKILVWIFQKIKNNFIKFLLLLFLIWTAYISSMIYTEANDNCTFYRVKVDVLNVRDGAGKKFQILGTLHKNNLVCIKLSTDNEWGYTNQNQWVNMKYLEKKEYDFFDDYIGPIIIGPIVVFIILLGVFKLIKVIFSALFTSGSSKSASPQNTKVPPMASPAPTKPKKKTIAYVKFFSGSAFSVYDENNQVLFGGACEELLGWNNNSVTIKRGNFILTLDSNGKTISSQPDYR